MSKALEIFERLYILLKPSAHNRISYTVLIVGLSLIASPVWEPILIHAADRLFGIKIEFPASPYLGLALVALALAYHHFTAKILRGDVEEAAEIRQRRQEHDTRLADRFRKLLPENQKDWLFNHQVGGNHACMDNEISAFDKAVNFLGSADSIFLHDNVRQASTELFEASRKFQRFFNSKFFIFPQTPTEGHVQYAMKPAWNMDREGNGSSEQVRRYDELADELNGHIDAVLVAYDALLRSFHERLQH